MTRAPESRPASGAVDYCLSCILTGGLIIAAVVASFAYLDIDFGTLFSADAAASMGRFAASFFPPDLDPDFLRKTAYGALQTFAVAMVGTLLAVAAGMLLALPAAGRHGTAAQRLSRFMLNFLRSVPELVWATLMVLAAGLGPFAGTLALALHTTGVLGRLFAEAIENAPSQPEQSLLETGSGGIAAFLYGTLPLIWSQCVAYGLYRLEMNIRMAAVLGFVGAGGLGQMLYYHVSIFQQAQAATVLIAVFVLVLIVDGLSDRLRAAMGRD